MAKLIVPTKAIAYNKGNKGTVSKKAKYHLLKNGIEPDGKQDGFTGCMMIFWSDNSLSDFGVTSSNRYDIKDVSELPADRLCKKCVGSMKLED